MHEDSELVVSDGDGGGEDAEDEEWLRGRLVLDVVFDGVLQEGHLGEHLRQDEREEDERVPRLANRVEVGGDAQLGDVDSAHADPLGRVHAEGHGQGLHAQLRVALDGLEVVHDGDAQPRDGVEDGQHHLLRRDGGRVKHGVAAPPRQSDVGGSQGEGARPTVRLELEGRGGINVGQEGPDGCNKTDNRPFVARPEVEAHREPEAADEKRVDLLVHLSLRNGARRNGAVGLVDGVQVTVIPVIDCLGEAAEDWPREHHGAHCLDGVLADHAPAVSRGGIAKEVPDGVVVARRRSAARNAPDQRNPRRRLHELKANLPVEGHVQVGLRRTL
mmetsp:Transcript_29120/g.85385  ORF Transcript_29120/g.85385 Transcript_29120/m.85385 type:complete len:330 (+) Transcript_29120:283-1272(+)